MRLDRPVLDGASDYLAGQLLRPRQPASMRRTPVRDVQGALRHAAVIDMAHTSISWLRDNMTVTLDVDTAPINEDELLETGRAIEAVILEHDALPGS